MSNEPSFNRLACGLSAEEIYDLLPEACIFDDELVEAIVGAFTLLEAETARTILERTFFIRFEGGSYHFGRDVIDQREIILLDAKDLATEKESIVTVLHESGHVFLGHGKLKRCAKDYETQEDDCWDLVRSWLPPEFATTIDVMEKEGGGSRSALPRNN